MGKSFFIIFFFLVVNLSAQTLKIDSLKKALPEQSDREKVSCFNALAREYNFSFIRSDSALHYANLAFEYASTFNDNVGKCVSLLTQADVQGRLLGNMEIMEKKCKLAIEFLQKEKAPTVLSLAYYKLAIAYHNEGKDELALTAAFKAKEISNAVKDYPGIGWSTEAIGLIYCHKGEYWKSFENLIESERIGKELNDSLLTAVSLAFIGRCFNRVGDPQRALDYYRQFLRYATPFVLLWPHIEDIAYAQLQLKQYDSVYYYQQMHQKNLSLLIGEPMVLKRFKTFFWGYSVEVQLAREQYDTVISGINAQLTYLREKGDVFPLMQSLLALGKAYQAKGKFSSAIGITRELLSSARKFSNNLFQKDANQLMSSLFDQTKQPDSAYVYFKNYIGIKDAMDTTQFAQRTALYVAASEAESRISLLERDRKIKEQQLVLNRKELLKQGQLKNTLVASLVILLLLSILVLRNNVLKRKNEKLQSDQVQLALKRKSLELEMQALRAQMNPHFIFNCLSAIDNLMQTNQPDKATSYLARFANLIRNVLESSKNNLVPFQKDFDTLKLYLEMEQFRCNNKFAYSLQADHELLNGDYKVPPLIIQPFVENAIHHGLLNKKDTNRQLKVTVHLKDEHIVYSVVDNGVGRKRAGILKEQNKPEHQSYGIDITRERIQLHNGNRLSHDVMITDLEQEGVAIGTHAIVKINGLVA